MLKAIADYGRLMRAGTALVRHDVILPGEYQTRLPLPARLAGRTMRVFGGRARGRPGERLAKALEKLGPAYIKLGQFLATRPDVFGTDVASDLSRLKDKLPPFPMAEARKALEREFGKDEAERLFPELGEPVAAASLAQVHKLETADGPKAVKILRPGVERLIAQELRAMKRAARTVERASVESRRLEPVAFTETVADSMMKELDLRLEAGGADQIRSISEKEDWFVVPAVDWDRTGQRVLTTDWVEGIPLTDPKALDQPGLNRTELANSITRGFLSQAIGHGVFHADMHEGNILILPDNRVALVDFGLIGRIGLNERRFLAEILWGFLHRDYQRVAEVHFEAGYVPAHQSVGEFAQALRSIGEPIHGKSAEDVYMGRILLQLLDYTRTFGMHLRPELVLLQKTMVQVEGVARAIDPRHDIWKAAEPIVKRWISENFGPAGAARLAARNIRDVADRLKRLPEVMDRFEASLAEPDAQMANVNQTGRPPWWAWFGLVIILAGIAGLTAVQFA
ncbi:2-polyprenylphenol 6-hydroxylase [Henriciella aquimarina]|uniref:2-polyprenylphenol 6-hydroxylase n=1 Tax=Henriciella aquimarina TaxID=545261 RepID=UPI000A06AE97|nr:2-polyprenylphenol 6-hydroxylase [Henriciella aquimarina]